MLRRVVRVARASWRNYHSHDSISSILNRARQSTIDYLELKMEMVRVLIADDYAPFRSGLRTMLATVPEFQVVGEAATGESAIELAQSLQPDVILMDIQMPQVDGTSLNGIEATRQIVNASPHIGVIMLTMFHDDDSVFAAMRTGARGYILKGAGRPELIRAIQAAAMGEALFSPAIAARLIGFFRDLAGNAHASAQVFPELTEREREVLQEIAQGASNDEIADRLHISRKTVRNHVSNIFDKLQVATRAQAIVRAREAGLG